MIEFDFNFQLITILLFSAMVVTAIVVFPVYIHRIRRVARYTAAHADDCEGLESAPQPDDDGLFTQGFSIVEDAEVMKAAAAGPASIVVYAQDQAEALSRLLPQLLEQRYEPGFEVIVVNEGGSEATTDVVSMLSAQHRNLYLTFTPDGARSLSRKKLALMLGIKAAQNRVVVHTMATATIESPLWLASIMRFTTSLNTARSASPTIIRSFSMSDCTTADSTSCRSNRSPAAWMRWVEVRRLRIISCRARCILG